ncbi:MAG TPA: N-acetylglucosamine-6-phosphate deacetylase [Cyanobacteria bacterium UBA8156]|jgi:N-acetylglucosamine-6-phosphate deacetylase|nr:N-acetylglucosamine-6-phosphate deacetylase [Cyanobacteria bacterium UBA8156]
MKALDLQINGALGLSFNDLHPGCEDKLAQVCEFLATQGLQGFLATLVTTDLAAIQRSLAVLARFQQQAHGGAQLLGVHLEGPFLHPAKRGAHPAAHLLPLTLNHLKRVLGDFTPLVKLVTLAPELDPTGAAIAYLRDRNIIVSAGHSQATAAEARCAFAQGVTAITHAFNAMPPLHHREPGLLGAALLDERIWCMAIADGVHVCPDMLRLLYRLKGDRLIIASDALAPFGLPDGEYPWDDRPIRVTQGTARLPDGTLAGTTVGLPQAVQNLVNWNVCTPAQAIAAVTAAPQTLLREI